MRITRNTILKCEALLVGFTWMITACFGGDTVPAIINALCTLYLSLFVYANKERYC